MRDVLGVGNALQIKLKLGNVCTPVVEGYTDVQIKVAVAHGRRAREFILHLGNLQADAFEPPQHVE